MCQLCLLARLELLSKIRKINDYNKHVINMRKKYVIDSMIVECFEIASIVAEVLRLDKEI